MSGARDDAALDKIHDEVRQELPRARAAATSWVAGLTAVAGVLGTATVVSTGTEVQDLVGGRLIVVGAALVVGAFGVTFGILRVYTAANMSPLTAGRAKLDPFIKGDGADGTGAANAWREAVTLAIKASESYRKQAVWATLAGVVALTVALAVTWLQPAGSATATTTCVEVAGSSLTFSGALPEVTSGEVTVVACP